MNIHDIARLAGVSEAAVSRYFNKGYVSKEKREAIAKAVEDTNYSPSIHASSLRSNKSRLIGVILPKIDSSAMGKMVGGILEVLEGAGYQILLATSENKKDKEPGYLRLFSHKNVEGILLIGSIMTAAHQEAFEQLEVPLVLLGLRWEGPCVYHDDYHALYSLTSRILEKGRTRLGFIGVTMEDESAGRQRFYGFRDAMADAGLDKDLAVGLADFSIESGYEEASRMLRSRQDLDALVCATDTIAIGALRYLRDGGIDSPGQIMVAGVGDSQLARVVTPTLTSIRIPFDQGGRLAAQMLLDLLEGRELEEEQVMMGYEVVERASTLPKPSILHLGHGHR